MFLQWPKQGKLHRQRSKSRAESFLSPHLRKCLVGLSIIATIMGCQPLNTDTTPTPLPTIMLPATPTPESLQTITQPAFQDIATEEPIPPTPFPTATNLVRLPTPENWQAIMKPESGLIVAAPPDWVDIGELANIEPLQNQLGTGHVLLIADQLDTGVQLLTGRPFTAGAFMLAFIPDEADQPIFPAEVQENPSDALDDLLRQWKESATIEIVPQGRLSGALAYINQDPSNIIDPSEQNVDLRLGLLVSESPTGTTPIYILLGEANGENGRYMPTLLSMVSNLNYAPEDDFSGESLRFLDVSSNTGGRDAIIGRLSAEAPSYWAFEAEAGKFTTFNVTPDGESDLTLTILAPSGRTIAEQDNGFGGDPEILLDVLLPESGVYVIQISEFFGVEDRYTLSLSVNDDIAYQNGGRIMLDQQLTGKLTVGQDDNWIFNGRAEQNISIIVNPQQAYDIVFTLYGPDGTEIATFDEGYSGDTEVLGNYNLPFTGEYRIGVRSFGEVVGEYTVALDEGNQSIANFYEAGDLIYGGLVQETLQAEEAQVWFLTGRAGDLITILAQPLTPQLDLDVWLLDNGRERLIMKDDTLSGETEVITYKLPRDGEYLVLVQDFFGEAGDYTIQLNVSEEDYLIESGEIVAGASPLESTLPAGRGAIWRFTGDEGDKISIRLEPINSETDFSLSLRAPDNQPILQRDETLAGSAEEILEFELPASGEWGLVVQEYFDNGGTYQLKIEQAEN